MEMLKRAGLFFGGGFRRGARRQGFTLAELLTVAAVAVVFAAMLLPALQNSRARAREISCTDNLRRLGEAFNMYADDWDGYWPRSYDGESRGSWDFPLYTYVGEYEPGASITGYVGPPVFACPEAREAAGPAARYDYHENRGYAGNRHVFHPASDAEYRGRRDYPTRIMGVESTDVMLLIDFMRFRGHEDYPDNMMWVIGGRGGTGHRMELSTSTGNYRALLDLVAYRHGGKANFLMGSGRVASTPPAEDPVAIEDGHGMGEKPIWYIRRASGNYLMGGNYTDEFYIY